MTDGTRVLTVPRHNPVNAITMGNGLDHNIAIQARRASEGVHASPLSSLACASGLYASNASISQGSDHGPILAKSRRK
jgi:hypothetical protein